MIQTGNNSSESKNERRLEIPTLNSSPNLPPEKAQENNIEDEDEAVVQLVFCAYNLNEAIQLAEQNFPHAEFNNIVKKQPNHANFLTKVKHSEIPNIIKSINDLNVVHLRTYPDKKTYAPEKPHHSQCCQVLPQK